MLHGSRLMTPAQRREACRIFEHGFVMMPSQSPSGLTRYKPLWALVEMGIVKFGFGPTGSWIKTYGFSPIWSDPII